MVNRSFFSCLNKPSGDAAKVGAGALKALYLIGQRINMALQEPEKTLI